MKNITISSVRIKKELITLLVCFLVGFIANAGAIIFYKTAASELFTSLGYVLFFGIALYLVWSLIRGISYLISRAFRKSNK